MKPSGFFSWFQAAAAARNSFKRLPTNAEWTVAALGTPDGIPDNGSTTSLDLLRWNGSAWSLDWNSVTIAPPQAGKRGFDITYEQNSGDAMVVYSNNTSTPRYRTRTAGIWSAETALPSAPLSGVVQWVQLAARPGTNEIGLAYSDANLRGRYLETTELARRYTKLLDALSAARRVDEIRVFHALDYSGKRERILQLQAPSPPPE